LGRRSASQRLSGQNAKPEIDPTLAELFRAFDERCDALLTLPSVEERRRAAHELCGASSGLPCRQRRRTDYVEVR
jgi:hypothetical protein